MRAFWVDAAIWCKNGSKRSILVAINHHQGFLRPAGWLGLGRVIKSLTNTPARRLTITIHPSVGIRWTLKLFGDKLHEKGWEEQPKNWWQCPRIFVQPQSTCSPSLSLTFHPADALCPCSSTVHLQCGPLSTSESQHQRISMQPCLVATSKRNPVSSFSVFLQSNHGSSILLHWMGCGESSLNAWIEALKILKSS